jgi:hypothetical protein
MTLIRSRMAVGMGMPYPTNGSRRGKEAGQFAHGRSGEAHREPLRFPGSSGGSMAIFG